MQMQVGLLLALLSFINCIQFIIVLKFKNNDGQGNKLNLWYKL